ncbi:hypothetical protein ACFY8K_09855 [Streptomyces misionensis]|uniref:hypothetical protein n=1 Tax=Streptomyces misionensis TaxID=67331 RepID=UPI003687C3A6
MLARCGQAMRGGPADDPAALRVVDAVHESRDPEVIVVERVVVVAPSSGGTRGLNAKQPVIPSCDGITG